MLLNDETNKKLREEPHKMLSDDKDMSNCFGFDVSIIELLFRGTAL